MSDHKFHNIPAEMRFYKQWVTWKYEQEEAGKKPTKVLYNPLFDGHASTDNPMTWVSYDDAVSAYEQRPDYWAGIGFVLTENDPYVFVDLDDASGRPDERELFDRQNTLYKACETYAEYSPSGVGLHLIAKGSVPRGRKRSQIELYSNSRFMTMTGNVIRDLPITDQNDLINMYWHAMEGPNARSETTYYQEAKEDDDAVLHRMFTAENGIKAQNIFEGHWTQYTQSHSEADQALMNIIVFYTQNKSQIIRLFQRSSLGQRKKAYRADYLDRTIGLAFDRTLPPIDTEHLKILFDKMHADIQAKGAAPEGPNATPNTGDAQTQPGRQASSGGDPHLTGLGPIVKPDLVIPPGLVGEIAEFIHSAAPRPVWEIALAGALGLVSGIAGRGYNVRHLGLNQYIVLLAPTGTGKEAVNSGISKIIGAAYDQGFKDAFAFLGPGQLASGVALWKWVANKPSCVAVLGEFGLMLEEWTAQNAPTHAKVMLRTMLDLYTKSGFGNRMNELAYSKAEDTVKAIEAPAFSIVGEGTPSSFYGALNEKMVSSGFLPRCVIIEYNGPRPPLNENTVKKPDMGLVNRIASFMANAQSRQLDPINVGFYEDANQLFKKFNTYCDAIQNAPGVRELVRDVWSRSLVSAYKLAAVVAVGIDFVQPMIDLDTAKWACAFIAKQSEALVEKFESGEVGNDDRGNVNDQYAATKRIIASWMLAPDGSECEKHQITSAMWLGRVLNKTGLVRRLRNDQAFKKEFNPGLACQNMIKMLIEGGELIQLSTSQAVDEYQTTAALLMIANPMAFFAGFGA